MAIITISRGSYSHGKEVAEKVARKLGYQCISRDLLIEASKEFNIPEIKLLQAIRGAPSILDRFKHGKERYFAYFRAALLKHYQKDNVVYFGLAARILVRKVSHVLRVRVTARTEDRIRLLMRREGIAKDKALETLKNIDEGRREWVRQLHGVDVNDSNLYDLVVHIKRVSTDEAAEIISFTAGLKRFQATAESQQAVEDLLLAARVKASLIERHPRVSVGANEGVVSIGLDSANSRGEEIQEAVGKIPGVKEINVDLYSFARPD